MLKRLIVTILISLLTITSIYAQDITRDKDYVLNPYEIGVDKNLDAHDLMKIEYKNTAISSDQVKLTGKVIIPVKYKVNELYIDYYIMDRTQEYTRVIPIELTKSAVPNTYTFEISYPLDLTKYEFELFVIEFYNELRDTQNI